MKPALLLAFVVFLLHVFVTAGHLSSPDDELLFRQTESLATRGAWGVLPLESNPATGELLVPADQTFATVQGRGGLFYPQYLPLQSILAAPLIWLADAAPYWVTAYFATADANTLAHPTMGKFHGWRRGVVVGLFNPMVAALTVLVLVSLASRLVPGRPRVALATAALWAFGTMAWPHSRTFFTEPLAGLLALVALDRLMSWWARPLIPETFKHRALDCVLLGVAIGGAVWTRMDSPLLGAGIGLALVAVGEWRRRVDRATMPIADYVLAAAPMIVAWVGLVLFNQWRFGGSMSLLGGGYGDQSEGIKFSTPLLVGLQGLLMSPGKSLLLFSPALVVAIWGWCVAPPEGKRVGLVIAGALFPFTLAMTTWQNWDGGWCWGPRHIMQIHAPLMLGAAFVLADLSSSLRRIAVIVIGVVAVCVQLLGSSQSSMDFYIEFYRTPEDGVYFAAPYRPDEAAAVRAAFGIAQPNVLPSPIVDSLYVPQHTQWAGYPAMWRMGYCDLLVVRATTGHGVKEWN